MVPYIPGEESKSHIGLSESASKKSSWVLCGNCFRNTREFFGDSQETLSEAKSDTVT